MPPMRKNGESYDKECVHSYKHLHWTVKGSHGPAALIRRCGVGRTRQHAVPVQCLQDMTSCCQSLQEFTSNLIKPFCDSHRPRYDLTSTGSSQLVDGKPTATTWSAVEPCRFHVAFAVPLPILNVRFECFPEMFTHLEITFRHRKDVGPTLLCYLGRRIVFTIESTGESRFLFGEVGEGAGNSVLVFCIIHSPFTQMKNHTCCKKI